MSTTGANLGLIYAYGHGFDGWDTGMDSTLAMLDALIFCSVKNQSTAAPPGSPTNGDRYIPHATASGAWTGKEGQIACRQSGAWVFYPPKKGFRIFDESAVAFYYYDGSAWTAEPSGGGGGGGGAITLSTKTANYSLVTADAQSLIAMNSGSGLTLTVPLNATQAFNIGDSVNGFQLGAGPVTIVATSGVAIETPANLQLVSRAQYSIWTLTKIDTDKWLLFGDLQGDGDIIVTTQTASYTTVLADADSLVVMNSATAVNFTIPPSTSVPYGVGSKIQVNQLAAGQVTLVAGAGVTLLLPADMILTTRKQGSTVTFTNIGTDTWTVTGDLTSGFLTAVLKLNFNTASLSTLPAGITNAAIRIIGGDGNSQTVSIDTFGTGGPSFSGRHALGTGASPTATTTGSNIFEFNGRGYGTTGFLPTASGRGRLQAAENYSDTASGSQWIFQVCKNGTVTLATALLIDQDLSVKITGYMNTFKGTLAALNTAYPAATVGSCARAFITDATTPVWGSAAVGGGLVKVPVYSDGANWMVG